jgi:Hint domain
MPPPFNIILNGTFDQQGANWGGTDIETTYFENSYFGTNNTNRVAEIDGNRGQITRMTQSFTIDAPIQTELTFIAALRTQNVTPGQDGFTVEILNSDGIAIASLIVLPSVATYQQYTLPVDFEVAGTYTLRFTELGPDNSFGAIVDNISMLVCFAGPTLIETPTGRVPASRIRAGDLVVTERGPMPVRWVGRRRVTASEMAANDKLRPVKITAGALGQGLPLADLRVSRQHRMLVSSPICQRMFGQTDILVSALKLTALPGIHIDEEVEEIDYIHLLFDQHEVIFAEGAPSESLLLQAEALAALTPEAREEIALLFPDLAENATLAPDAKLIPKGHQQARLADRMVRNDRAPLEAFRRQSA